MLLDISQDEYRTIRRALDSHYFLIVEEGELSELREINEIEHKLIEAFISNT